jgi:hypothetical protein
MTYVFRILILMLVGLFVSLSASADDRLTVTGGIDNRIYGGSNLSAFDYNFTNLPLTKGNSQAGDADDLAVAITRLRVTLSMEAFENTKVVFDTVTDQAWGGGAGANALHIGNYKKVINVERLFFEGLIPNTAATMQAGGLFFEGTRLKSWTLFNMNAAGATIAAPFSDTVNTYTWFAWLGEGYDDVGKVDGKADGGNDWALGTRVEFTPMQDLDVDLIFAYQRLECLDQGSGFAGDCDTQTLLVRNSQGTDGKSLQLGSRVMYENRAWVGIDVRYQFGDFTFSPTLIYHFGETELDQSGEGEVNSFLFDVRASYQMGPLQLQGKVVYSPGTPASNRLGDGDRSRSWQQVGVYNGHSSVGWFSIFGASSMHNLGPALVLGYATSRATNANLSFDQFGLFHVAVRADYTINEKTTVWGALGIFNAAEDVGRPCRLGCEYNYGDDGNPTFNYTGNDTHLGTEVDVWLSHKLYPNAVMEFWAAYLMTGDALDLVASDDTVAKSQDAVGAGIRFAYDY